MSAGQTPLLPDDWGNLAPLVDQLLDSLPSERPVLLAALAGDNSALRIRLEQLLAECERDLPLLERPAAELFTQLREEETEPRLPELLGGRYRIEHEVGRGGMARVYLALDVRHARRVAVKVIRHEIASSLMRDRFLREIGIAARLRHPNIMPLYDSGDVDGQLYFVMPYEEGKSLRARLDKEHALGVAEGVSILRDVARALAYAHEQGVVHRDIKPDNVLLSGDAAVVTDFGIAKAFTAAATDVGTHTVTQAGTIIGTAAYMAPEQAIGDPATDHRADIYSFGCLAYELFAGAPPFAGTTAHQVISAQLSDTPKPLTDHRRDVPHNVSRLIARCLEKNPDARPASAAELLVVLGASATTEGPSVAPRPRHHRLVAASLFLSLIILGAWYAARATGGGPVTMSVLPLEVTGDSLYDLAEGFGDDLAAALVRQPWLSVKSRGGARNYSGRSVLDPRMVADSLDVEYLLMGGFRQKGDGISVTVQLIRGEDGTLVWAHNFSHPNNLEQLRDQIVKAVGDSLKPYAGRFANQFRVDTKSREYSSTDDAYTLYLKGKTRFAQRGPGIREAIDLFHEAKALDSTSAYAWSGLSLALAASVTSQLASIDSIRPEAVASAERALRLDSLLAEPHIALGLVHALDYQWGQAEAAFKTAVERNPHDAEARIAYARLLISLRRLDEAFQQIESAYASDRASTLVLTYKAFAHQLRGERDSADVWSDRAIKVNPLFITRIFRAMLLVRLNRGREARQLVEGLPGYEPYSLYVIAASGDSATVRARLAALAGLGNAFPAAGTAQAYAFLGLGDTAKALDALESATDRREIWPTISYLELPAFDAVRESPRFRKLLNRVGLPAR